MDKNVFFTAQEWHTLQFAPLWVTTAWAGPDGKIGEKQQEVLNSEIKKIVDKVFFAFINITEKFQKKGREFPKGEMELEKVLIEEGWSLLDVVMASAPFKDTKDAPWIQKLQSLFFRDPRTPSEGLKDVADVLKKNASAEHAREFKEFLLNLNQKISETYKVGLFGLSKKQKKKKEETLFLVSNVLEA